MKAIRNVRASDAVSVDSKDNEMTTHMLEYQQGWESCSAARNPIREWPEWKGKQKSVSAVAKDTVTCVLIVMSTVNTTRKTSGHGSRS